MTRKHAYQFLSSVVILASSACTGCGHVEYPPPSYQTNACARYGGLTVALAEATVDCTGTIGPESFTIDKDGQLKRKFSQCIPGTSEEAKELKEGEKKLKVEDKRLKEIDALLAFKDERGEQDEKRAGFQQCLTKRYNLWSTLFKRTGLNTCPTWSKVDVFTKVDRNTTAQIAKTQPHFQYFARTPSAKELKPSAEEDFVALQVPAKSTVLYKISYSEKPTACADVAVCAAQCAAFLPGFVVSAAGDQLVADPVTWYGDLAGQSCPGSANPYCPPYVHGMSITITSPDSTVPAGDLYGHPNRGGNGEKCVRWMPDDHHGPGTDYITDLNRNGTGANSLSKCGN